jgi:hypothetical protein
MNSQGAIFLLQEDQSLLELREHAYDSEDLLQKLLADYPTLLAGEQVNRSNPRRWLLVRREAGVPSKADSGNQWSIDNLFLDQEGIPTIVEVKRSTDTRIRREVVGQMLDYAANAVAYWPVTRIRSMFEDWHGNLNHDPDEVLSAFLQAEDDGASDEHREEFWRLVDANLQAHRIRMIFVADAIPPELQRIIEFLNEQTTTAEVLGLEIKQYVGQGAKTLVPRVIGQTAQAQANKSSGTPAIPWDRGRFLTATSERSGQAIADIAARILEKLEQSGWSLMWGRGSVDGSCQPVYKDQIWPLFLWTYGRIQIQYGNLLTKAPFDRPEKRQELRERLRRISGIELPDEVDKYPGFPMSILTPAEELEKLMDAWQWTAQEFSAYQASH